MADLYPKNKLPIKEVKKFIVIFYAVGLVGFILPQTSAIFQKITPLALLLSTYLLAVYHEKFTLKETFGFLIIYILGFLVEVIGVQTGAIFGSYRYGAALGPKLWGTPLMIGINWIFLTYTSVAMLQHLKINRRVLAFVAPLLMVIYDVVLEQVAPKIDMWAWENDQVPLQNYLAWYAIAFVFVAGLNILKIQITNKLATILFINQFVFFILLNVAKNWL